MGNRKKQAAPMLIAVLTLCLAACSMSIAGSPTTSPSPPIRLATGNLPTTPRQVPAATNAADAWLQEGWRMADGVAAPWSIEPTLTHAVTQAPTLPLLSPLQLTVVEDSRTLEVFRTEQRQFFIGSPFLAGFIARASDGAAINSSAVATGFLRFADDNTATRILPHLTQSTEPVPDGFPSGTSILGNDSDPQPRVAVASQRGDLVLVAAGMGPTKERAADLARRALEAQIAKVGNYSATVYEGVPPLAVPMDVDGIVARTLPPSGASDPAWAPLGLSATNNPFVGYRSIYAHGLMGMLPLDEVRKLREEDGVDLISLGGSSTGTAVYRAQDTAAARRLIDRAVPESGLRGTVPGLTASTSRCQLTEKTNYTRCWITYGRYAASLTSPTRELAEQAAAAQYLILKNAG